MLLTEGLPLTDRVDRAVIPPVGQLRQPRPALTELPLQLLRRDGRQLADGFYPYRLKAAFRDGSDPPNHTHGQLPQELFHLFWTHDHQTVRLAETGGDLCHKFVRAHTGRGGETKFPPDSCLHPFGDGRGRTGAHLVLGYVQKRLVKGHGFHKVCVVPEYKVQSSRYRPVTRHAHGKEIAARAELPSRCHGHGGPNAELPGFIRGGTDNPARPQASHDHRLPPQGWVIPLLDRCVEGIHIHMDDLPLAHVACPWKVCSGQSLPPMERREGSGGGVAFRRAFPECD